MPAHAFGARDFGSGVRTGFSKPGGSLLDIALSAHSRKAQNRGGRTD
jgi:hypothetical protein